MVLADILSHLRTQALQAPGAHLMSVATLTGHAMRTAGPYPIVLDNGPARAEDSARTMSARAEHWGSPSRNATASGGPRLHPPARPRLPRAVLQPRALGGDHAGTSCGRLLAQASGLSAHGLGAEQPLPYTHLDLAGSVCEGATGCTDAPQARGPRPRRGLGPLRPEETDMAKRRKQRAARGSTSEDQGSGGLGLGPCCRPRPAGERDGEETPDSSPATPVAIDDPVPAAQRWILRRSRKGRGGREATLLEPRA